MLSGRYVSRTRSFDNAGILPSDVPTFAHHLRLAGYETAACGNMHIIGADQLHGFERRLTGNIYPADFSWAADWRDVQNKMEKPLTGKGLSVANAGPCDWNETLAYSEKLHFNTIEFLRSHHNSSQPFCLMTCYLHPHPPYQAPRAFWDLYQDSEIDIPEIPGNIASCQSQMDRWMYYFEGIPDEVINDEKVMRRFRRSYYAMVSYLDSKVGELLETLDALVMRENTIILFTSDHGDMLGERGLVEKRVFYEPSARVPLIASFPACWPGARTCNQPVSLIDIFPTLTDIASAPQPIAIDGTSFLDVLENESNSAKERVVLSENHSEGVMAPCFMARKGKYKYIYVHGYDKQLFDLESDPNELNNLAGIPDKADIEVSMKQEIFSRFDPDKIARNVQQSQAEHKLIRQAMLQGQHNSWDYQP